MSDSQENKIRQAEILAQVDQGKSAQQVVDDAKLQAETDYIEKELEEKKAEVERLAEEAAEEEVSREDRETVAKLARELMTSNVRLSQCVGTMIAARQLYAVCCNDMDRQIAKLPKEQQHELLGECLTQAATHQAAAEFDENDLFMGFTETVMPWMQATIALHNTQDKIAREQELDELEAERRKRHLPLGFKYDPDLGEDLRRNSSLVLVGWQPAVQYILDKAMTSVLAARVSEQLFYLIRLVKKAPDKEGAHKQLLRLGGKDWENCCRSTTSWPLLFQARLLEQMTEPLDLLIVDDLDHAYDGVTAATESRNSGNAHKKFRQWATKMGSGVLAGVPLMSKSIPDLSGAGWHELRTFSTLRAVWVEEKEEDPLYYTLRVGRDAYLEKVPKATLDNFGGGNIIIPK